MKVCMTLLVRDEEEIIRENIEYHLSRGVDFIIATDNLSRDRTPDILKSYERKGCLRYILESSDDYSQDLWVTRMSCMASVDYHADWVIHLDADEFWWPYEGGIKSVLNRCPDDVDGLIINRVNFLTPSDYDPTRSMFDQMTLRQSTSTNPLGNPLLPKICHRGNPDVIVTQGNHNFEIVGQKTNQLESTEAAIFHFPLRSFQSLENKIALGGAAYERNTRLRPWVGDAWRELYKIYLKGELNLYYQDQVIDRAQMDLLRKNGKAISDVRLRDYMRNIDTGLQK